MTALTGRILVVGDPECIAPDAYPVVRRYRRGFTGHTVWHRGHTDIEQAFARAWRTERGAVEPCDNPIAALRVVDLLIVFLHQPARRPASYAARCAAAAVLAGCPLLMFPPDTSVRDLDMAATHVGTA